MYVVWCLLAIIGIAIAGVGLIWASTHKHVKGTLAVFMFFSGSLGCMLALIWMVMWVSVSYDWLGASNKARIINAEYGTNYTTSDVFYASDVIEEVRQAKRTRVEVNGDLFKTTENK